MEQGWEMVGESFLTHLERPFILKTLILDSSPFLDGASADLQFWKIGS